MYTHRVTITYTLFCEHEGEAEAGAVMEEIMEVLEEKLKGVTITDFEDDEGTETDVPLFENLEFQTEW